MQQNNGLDKNQLISFMLFSALMLGAMFYFQSREEAKAPAPVEQTASTQGAAPTMGPQASNSGASPVKVAKLENNELRLEFSSLGGQISRVELPGYKAYNQAQDLSLIHI